MVTPEQREYARAWARRDYYTHRRATRFWREPANRVAQFVRRSNSRAALYGVEGRITAGQVQSIVGPCHYCGGESTSWDHHIPLWRGGANNMSNLVPACWPCNRRKSRGMPKGCC